MKRTLPIAFLAATALAMASACSARTDAPSPAALEEPEAMDASVSVRPVDEKSDADGPDEPNPFEDPAFEALPCGNTYCGPDQRCCRAIGQCFPADCPDCCDGVREGYFGDGPEVFDMHPGPADGPIRDQNADDGWIKHDLEPDGPEPNE